MKCPFCSSENTKVIDSRPVEEGGAIRRRRLCGNCSKRFTTYEKIETIPLNIIKKDKGREMYDRAKLESGILRACYKRPVSTANIQHMIDQIETELYNQEEKEVSSKQVGEIVMRHLKEVDGGAYVRFASVYREFKDVDTFMDELKKLMDQ